MKRALYLSILYVTIFGALLAGCSLKKYKDALDVTMHFREISPDGTVLHRFDAPVQATITDHANETDSIQLKISPTAFYRYTINNLDDSDFKFLLFNEMNDLPYYSGFGSAFNQETGLMSGFYFALDFKNQYMIVAWSDDPNKLLIGSSDPNAELSNILAHFELFLISVNLETPWLECIRNMSA